MGGSLELAGWRLHWTEIVPLYSNVGDKQDPVSKKKKKEKKKSEKGHCCPVYDHIQLFSCLPLSMMLDVVFHRESLSDWWCLLLFLVCWIMSNAFLNLLRWLCSCSLFYWLIFCITWNTKPCIPKIISIWL